LRLDWQRHDDGQQRPAQQRPALPAAVVQASLPAQPPSSAEQMPLTQ
jgi:hypothetical protein